MECWRRLLWEGAVLGAVRTGLAAVVLAALALGAGPRPADAVLQYGPMQLSGSVETQNIIRHSFPSVENPNDRVQFIQNRNTAKIRFDWDWIQGGKVMERYELPWIKESHFYLLYRGAYDGFYDIAPGGKQIGQFSEDDRIGGPIKGNNMGTVDADGNLLPGPYSRFTGKDRDGRKWENTLREVYADITLADAPVTFRIGRQQVIWGEADQFRLMDIWNPLDVTWRFPLADTFDDFRVPLWLIKGMVDLGTLGPFSNSFVEFVYNPGDFQPGQKIAWLPNPWSLPYADPLRDGQVQVGRVPGKQTLVLTTPEFDLNGTSFRHGDFKRGPEEASEFGVRAHAVLPNGMEMTINYVYGRGKWVGTSPAFGVKLDGAHTCPIWTDRGCYDQPSLGRAAKDLGTFAGYPVMKSVVEAEVVHPYNHVFGLTWNYFESEVTSSVLRMETAYALGEPFATSNMEERMKGGEIGSALKDPETGFPLSTGMYMPIAMTKRDVWAGMLGFDRPTWIRALNNKTTFFISGQLFWMNIPGHNVRELRGFSSAAYPSYFTPALNNTLGYSTANVQNPKLDRLASTGGFGRWDGCSTASAVLGTKDGVKCPFAGVTERTQGYLVPDIYGNEMDGAPADHYHPWEFMTTLIVDTFYRGGTINPRGILLFDPANLWVAPMAQVVWQYTPALAITLQERLVFPLASPMNDPWFIGRFGRRNETAIKLTYTF